MATIGWGSLVVLILVLFAIGGGVTDTIIEEWYGEDE